MAERWEEIAADLIRPHDERPFGPSNAECALEDAAKRIAKLERERDRLRRAQGRQWQHGHDQASVSVLLQAADWFEKQADNTVAYGPKRVADQLRRMAMEEADD